MSDGNTPAIIGDELAILRMLLAQAYETAAVLSDQLGTAANSVQLAADRLGVPALPAAARPGSWRTGRHRGEHIYEQLGDAPSDTDRLVGTMHGVEDAALTVLAVNAYRRAIR